MFQKLRKLVKVVSFLGAAAAALTAFRKGTAKRAEPATGTESWPDVPRKD